VSFFWGGGCKEVLYRILLQSCKRCSCWYWVIDWLTDIWPLSPHRAIFFRVLNFGNRRGLFELSVYWSKSAVQHRFHKFCQGSLAYFSASILSFIKKSTNNFSVRSLRSKNFFLISSLKMHTGVLHVPYIYVSRCLLSTNKIHLSGKSRYLLFYIIYFSNVSREIKQHFPCNFNLPYAAQLQAIYVDESIVYSSMYLGLPEKCVLFVAIRH